MADLLKMFAQDDDAMVKGVWVTLNEGEDDEFSLRVAATDNKEHKKFMRKAQMANRYKISSNNESALLEFEKLARQAKAKTVLKDWRNVEVDGTPVKYTSKMGLEMMKNHPQFETLVDNISNDQEKYKKGADDETEGNSPSS